MTKGKAKEIDETSYLMAENTRKILEYRRVSYADFGRAIHYSKSLSELNRTLNLGLGASENVEWSWTFMRKVAAYFDLRPDQLAEKEPSRLLSEVADQRIWHAASQSPAILMKKVQEHQSEADIITGVFFSIPPLMFLDDRVQRAWIRSSLAEAGSAAEIKRIKAAYNGLGNARRDGYASGEFASIRPKIMVAKSCFESTFLGDPTKVICSRAMRSESLEYLRKDSIHERGLQLGIFDDSRVPVDIAMMKRGIDAFAVIGSGLTTRKLAGGHKVRWSEDREVVSADLKIAEEVARYIEYDWTNPNETEKIVEHYQRQLE